MASSRTKRDRTGFDMTPKVNGKANSQGTLFQGGLGQMKDSARYPKGYTPERMKSVTEALTKSYPEHRFGFATAKEIEEKGLHVTDTQHPGDVANDNIQVRHTKIVTQHLLKDPAEQVSATKAGNKAACPECRGAGTIPSRTYESTNWDTMKPEIREVPAEHCWNCQKTPGGSAKGPGTGLVSLKSMAENGGVTPEMGGGKSGIHGPSEIIPKGHTHPFLNPAGGTQIREAIARSTVPVEHLKNVRRIAVVNNRTMKNAAGHFGIDGIGLETAGKDAPTVVSTSKGISSSSHPEHQRRESEKAATTLIHEIGHAAGATGGDEHTDEAKADAYMLQHQRPDPRTARKMPAAMKGSQWLYSRHAGDTYDPDAVHAPGETDAMKAERLTRAPAANFRSKPQVAKRAPLTLF